MSRYRKKPVVIEAMQFTGENLAECLVWALGMSEEAVAPYRENPAFARAMPMVIPTLEGDMTADKGDWIIKGVAGEFYPCKPDIFAATYEPVQDNEALAAEDASRREDETDGE